MSVEEIISSVGGYHHLFLAEVCGVSGDRVWKNWIKVFFDVGSLAGAGGMFSDYNDHDIEVEFYGSYIEPWRGFKD